MQRVSALEYSGRQDVDRVASIMLQLSDLQFRTDRAAKRIRWLIGAACALCVGLAGIAFALWGR